MGWDGMIDLRLNNDEEMENDEERRGKKIWVRHGKVRLQGR